MVVAVVLLVGLWWWSSQPSADGALDSGGGTSATSATATTTATTRASARATTRARTPRDTSGLPVVHVSELPDEARETLAVIAAGGPFPYSRDGAVFQNRERILPRKASGWYREYTVPTPGEDDRGARRIVTGRDGLSYWTDDHYDSFSVIEEER